MRATGRWLRAGPPVEGSRSSSAALRGFVAIPGPRRDVAARGLANGKDATHRLASEVSAAICASLMGCSFLGSPGENAKGRPLVTQRHLPSCLPVCLTRRAAWPPLAATCRGDVRGWCLSVYLGGRATKSRRPRHRSSAQRALDRCHYSTLLMQTKLKRIDQTAAASARSPRSGLTRSATSSSG